MKSIHRIKYLALTLVLMPATALAQIGTGVNDAAPTKNGEKVGPQSALEWLGSFTNMLMYLAGAIAVIVIIFGGIRYVTSTGDATRVKQAKDTILFGIIGLVISLLAFAIVKFVIANVN